MPDNVGTETDRWLRYARWDLDTAERNAADDSMPPSNVCYTSQQAAEKVLKAALIFLEIEPPRVHNLDTLRNLLPDDWQTRGVPLSLSNLTVWAVEARYPSDSPDPTIDDAQTAVMHARQVFNLVMMDLVEHGYDLTEAG